MVEDEVEVEVEVEEEVMQKQEVEKEVVEEKMIPRVKTMYRHQGQGMGFDKGEVSSCVNRHLLSIILCAVTAGVSVGIKS